MVIPTIDLPSFLQPRFGNPTERLSAAWRYLPVTLVLVSAPQSLSRKGLRRYKCYRVASWLKVYLYRHDYFSSGQTFDGHTLAKLQSSS